MAYEEAVVPRSRGATRKLTDVQEVAVAAAYDSGVGLVGDIATAFGVSRQTVYNIVRRRRGVRPAQKETA